jgi:hypothetical protein
MRLRAMGTLPAGHPAIGEQCIFCDLAVAVGDVVSLWPAGSRAPIRPACVPPGR